MQAVAIAITGKKKKKQDCDKLREATSSGKSAQQRNHLNRTQAKKWSVWRDAEKARTNTSGAGGG